MNLSGLNPTRFSTINPLKETSENSWLSVLKRQCLVNLGFRVLPEVPSEAAPGTVEGDLCPLPVVRDGGVGVGDVEVDHLVQVVHLLAVHLSLLHQSFSEDVEDPRVR